ncbi:MAG: hypothetical protein Q8O87_04140 [bacterium]|nr:hypothetical protein [bacterium]
MIKIGQIWKFNKILTVAARNMVADKKEVLLLTGPLTAIEIIGLNKQDIDIHHQCEIVRDDNKLLLEAARDCDKYIILLPDDFIKAIKINQWTLLVNPPIVGTTCISCKRHYPYASHAIDFKCWGCRNGY